jgi:hypothetical protein
MKLRYIKALQIKRGTVFGANYLQNNIWTPCEQLVKIE